jgi:uncharacterized protein (DUF1810 family)
MNDPFHLERFLEVQRTAFDAACAELRTGRKKSHWMWFIFPQLRGLGSSPTAQAFAISSIEEAAAYLQHPVLGLRLRHATELVNAIEGRSLDAIFGYPDNLKFRSSMTLFAEATPDNRVFIDALDKYCSGQPDPVTLRLLRP